ncbi:MltA domain protein [Solidesulfovibrio fructosivorans JJ]]|uniref:peptidoglycan lytic exotransglycosylase n=1 Tax=Solidesulfovibrio fructosivorans JJ] TaxID=596151 RepID=E1JS88_SOLFR|nr:MltA domain-containing protein [Solidesulfovibrio fructosivorans]EFL52857.1 MltA domain protein [Solidesulfovibrio fructosivorans JJ]]
MRRHISNFSRLLSACCILAAVLALAGCAGVRKPAPTRPATTQKIPAAPRPLGPWDARISPTSQQIPSFSSLAPAVDRSIAYASRKPASAVAVDVPGATLTWGRLRQGLVTFRRILPELDRDPSVLARYFTWVPLPTQTLVTGYYAPTIEVSRTEHGPYAWPIYRNPGGRMAKKYNREAIDFFGALRGKGLEIGWARDPIAVFFLHVQGSGRLRFVEDGSTSYVLYAGSNGRRYVGVGRVMVNAGCFTDAEMSMQAIRHYLEEHPSQIKQYLTANPSYIYFKPSQTPPVGAMGVPVTPHASVAVDPGFVPYGALMVLDADLPGYPGPASERFTGFVMAQDTGCMRGNHFDLYLGPGDKAAHQAGLMKGTGQAYILVPR